MYFDLFLSAVATEGALVFMNFLRLDNSTLRPQTDDDDDNEGDV
jgi:hypothetical protein